MYYICKFSDTWSLYDEKRNNSRQLDKDEIDCLKRLFPGLLSETGKILTAIKVSSINPSKLLQLPNPENHGAAKKEKV